MSAPTDYSALITSEHNDKPKFIAAVELLVSGASDGIDVLASMPGLYDFETAVGVQLDTVGLWVGLTRYQDVPTLGIVTLPDADFRTLLRARILANHWDGGMETLQTILAGLFPGTGMTLYAVDNQDMSMDIYITGASPTALQLALLKGGLLVPKPEGVRINGFIQVAGILFGLDFDNASISGPDVGAFVNYL